MASVLLRATRECFDGQTIREAGEVFSMDLPPYMPVPSWAEPWPLDYPTALARGEAVLVAGLDGDCPYCADRPGATFNASAGSGYRCHVCGDTEPGQRTVHHVEWPATGRVEHADLCDGCVHRAGQIP